MKIHFIVFHKYLRNFFTLPQLLELAPFQIGSP